jgi:hypothetical protein
LPSVWRTVCKTFGWYYAIGGVYKLVYDLISFVSPLLLRFFFHSSYGFKTNKVLLLL